MKNLNTLRQFHVSSIRFWMGLRHFLHKKILGVMCGSLLALWLGIGWVVFSVERLAPGANITSYGDSIWWGIVTFLTVGYGDRYPVTTEGRLLGGLLMVAGVVSMGVVTAKIASYFLEQALKEGRGQVDPETLRDHFIICGWKEEMHQLLMHILDFNPTLTSNQIVVVANLQEPVIETLRSEARLKDCHFIVGDYYNEANLKRAAPVRARKILILADRTPNEDGNIPTPMEVDARTIMTAMTLSHIARGTLVAAEILDSKMDDYLKLASVTEIIYSREYSRLMLCNASAGTGLANVIFDLLDPKHSSFITTLPLESFLHGKAYADVKKHFESMQRNTSVIGILENSGNRQSIKELALKRAQKTPDINQLVKNLKDVKELRCNHPVFNPATDYIVEEGSMVIVIETREAQATQGGRHVTAAA